PEYQKREAWSILAKWGCELADKVNAICVIESSSIGIDCSRSGVMNCKEKLRSRLQRNLETERRVEAFHGRQRGRVKAFYGNILCRCNLHGPNLICIRHSEVEDPFPI
ncbi:hypothetical protein CC78DRAFT_478852, partial [Lojkania enalia]